MASSENRVQKVLFGEDRLYSVPMESSATGTGGCMQVIEEIDEDFVPECGVDNVIEVCLPLACGTCGFETSHCCPRCTEHRAS
ncbi:hypothetical protein BH686_02905 [Rhodococcus erythropolis]|nr:hypothetical protein BH686_02905 [Rhodococcus erythropolis]